MTLTAIAGPGLSAEIDSEGAQLHSLRDGEGRDLLWGGDPAVWNGRAPVLFPIVGALAGGQFRLDGQTFVLPRHGFARRMPFAVVEAGPSSITLRLSADAQTRAAYPFEFELDMTFAIDGAALTMTATIRNLCPVPLPVSFGFHPALRWPLPYGQPPADHALTFDRDEPAPIRRLDAEGLILPQGVASPVAGRTLPLGDALFADDAIVWDHLRSSGLTYGAPTGPRLRIDFADAPYLGVWTKPGAGYICIEPWWGIADPQGYAGDFMDKPGVFRVAPGQARGCAMTIALQNQSPG